MDDPASGAIGGLKGSIRGQVLLRNDLGYEEARHIWNAMIDPAGRPTRRERITANQGGPMP